MSVVTRIDSRSENNNSFQIRNAVSGKVLAVVETLCPETRLRIGTGDDVVIVKSNGAILKRK